MKKTNKLSALILLLTLIFGVSAYASFPVKNETKKEQTVKENGKNQFNLVQKEALKLNEKNLNENTSVSPKALDDETLILIILWALLGFLAGHRWYKKKPIGWNILFILTAGGCGVWALIDLIHIVRGEF